MPNLLLNYHHNEVKVTLELHLKFHKLTLAAEMFGVGDFWMEIRVIIKILSHPWYPRTFEMIFIEVEQKKKQFEKKSKMANSKKLSFSKSSILKSFLRKFHRLVLGLVELIGSWISRMGQNFNDYSDFQPKITHPKYFCPECN